MQDGHDHPDDLMHNPPAYPPIVRFAAIIWIVMGSVILLFALYALLAIGSAIAQDARAGPPWRVQPGHPVQDPLFWGAFFFVGAAITAFGIGAVLIVGFSFVFTGYQTLTGKATDTLGKAIWSLVIGFAELAYACLSFNRWMDAAVVVGFPFVIGIHVLGGFAFLAAAAMASRGREGYKTWRRWFKRYPAASDGLKLG